MLKVGSRLNEIKGFYSHGIPSGFNYRLAANHCRAALLHSVRPALPLLHRALNLFSEPGADAHIDATAPFQPLFAHARPGTTGTADRSNVSLLFRHLFPTGGETRDPFLRGRSPAAKATVPRNGKRPRAEGSRAAQEWLYQERSMGSDPAAGEAGRGTLRGFRPRPRGSAAARRRLGIFWFPSSTHLFLGVESGNRAPVPEARPSPVPPLGAPRSRSAPPRQQPPGNARLLPAPPPPLPGWWSGPRPHGAAGPPLSPATAEAAATCFGRQPPPRCSTPRSGTHAPCAHTSPLRSERPGQSS